MSNKNHNMGSEGDLLSTEIVNRGIESSGPNAGSQTFSVRVRRRLPDFLQSVNLKYVKLGYHYLINHAIYLATIPVLVLVFSAEVGSLSREELWRKLWEDARYDLATVLSSFGVLVFTLSVYFMSRPRSIYLIDFACFKPNDDLKVTKEQFIDLARKSEKFDEASVEFQKRILMSSGIGDETYIPMLQAKRKKSHVKEKMRRMEEMGEGKLKAGIEMKSKANGIISSVDMKKKGKHVSINDSDEPISRNGVVQNIEELMDDISYGAQNGVAVKVTSVTVGEEAKTVNNASSGPASTSTKLGHF